MIVPAKIFAPKENRMHRAQTIKANGQQKKMSVSEPRHADRLNPAGQRAKRNPVADARRNRSANPSKLFLREFQTARVILARLKNAHAVA
jgi:hypothetical protein